MGILQIVVAFPVNDKDREALRRMAPEAKLPVLVQGWTGRPCDDCGMMLGVGPRSAAVLAQQTPESDVVLCCPRCAIEHGAGMEEGVAVVSFNPESSVRH